MKGWLSVFRSEPASELLVLRGEPLKYGLGFCLFTIAAGQCLSRKLIIDFDYSPPKNGRVSKTAFLGNKKGLPPFAVVVNGPATTISDIYASEISKLIVQFVKTQCAVHTFARK